MLSATEATKIAKRHGLSLADAVSLRSLADTADEAAAIATSFRAADTEDKAAARTYARELFGDAKPSGRITITAGDAQTGEPTS